MNRVPMSDPSTYIFPPTTAAFAWWSGSGSGAALVQRPVCGSYASTLATTLAVLSNPPITYTLPFSATTAHSCRGPPAILPSVSQCARPPLPPVPPVPLEPPLVLVDDSEAGPPHAVIASPRAQTSIVFPDLTTRSSSMAATLFNGAPWRAQPYSTTRASTASPRRGTSTE